MEDKRLIQKLKLQNFLSYGNYEEIELQSLNVLIGPNGSGKSNLIEVFSLFKAAPTNLLVPIRKGGVSEFLWKGKTNENVIAQIGVVFANTKPSLDYQLSFTSVNQRLEIVNEIIHGIEIDKVAHQTTEQSVPDILPIIADMLIDASQRTQLIVTTHSDGLVSALSEYADSVLVCEHDEAGSHLRRLDSQRLKIWLEKYSLGELWLMGEIGGNKW